MKKSRYDHEPKLLQHRSELQAKFRFKSMQDLSLFESLSQVRFQPSPTPQHVINELLQHLLRVTP